MLRFHFKGRLNTSNEKKYPIIYDKTTNEDVNYGMVLYKKCTIIMFILLTKILK